MHGSLALALAAPGRPRRLANRPPRSRAPPRRARRALGTAKSGVPMKTMRIAPRPMAEAWRKPRLTRSAAHGMASQEIEALTQALARLPGLGPRSARRAVLHLMKKRETALPAACCRAAANVAERLSTCSICGNVDTSDPCAICARPAPRRQDCCASSRKSPTCGRSIARGCFPGRYHVLGGRLSALEGVRPEDLSIDKLVAPRRRRRHRRGRAGDERHARGPDHRPLSRRTARSAFRSASPSSPTACRSAASSTISTRARSPRRCARAVRLLEAPGLKNTKFSAMALLPIIEVPDPRLRQISTPVEKVDDEVRALVADMFETMYAAPGIGLAAIQVGVAQAPAGDRPAGARGGGRRAGQRPARLHQPRDPRTFGAGRALYRGLPVGARPICRGRPARPHPRPLARSATARSARKRSTACSRSACSTRWTISNGVLFIDHLSRLKRDMI